MPLQRPLLSVLQLGVQAQYQRLPTLRVCQGGLAAGQLQEQMLVGR